MYAFDYSRPRTLAELVEGLRADPDSKILAGGQTLIPTLKQRLAQPSRLMALAGVEGLRQISRDGDTLAIGALACHADVAGSTLVAEMIPALAHLAQGIGDPAVRHRGTLGGSIANNDPAADYPAALLALGARILTDRRMITADDFFTGLFSTALAEDEVITAVHFPKPARAAYVKFPNPASRYAIVGVFVVQTNAGVRVAVTGAGAGVFRVAAFEEALARDFSPKAIEAIAVSATGLNEDLHASAAYRAHLIGVMARRAVAAA